VLSAFSRRRGQEASPGSVIGFINWDIMHRPISEGLIHSAESLGYKMERFALAEHPSQQALVEVLRARGTMGVLFAEIPKPIELVPGVWDGMQGVYCGPYPAGDGNCPMDIVRHNPFDAVLLAWQKAVEAGCRRIGLVLPTQNAEPSMLELKTLAAYRLLQAQAGPGPRILEPMIKPIELLTAEPGLLSEWHQKNSADVILGAFHAVYFLLCSQLPHFREKGRFIALRVMEDRDDVAGCLLEREAVAQLALRRLHALIQDPLPPTSHSFSMVLNPVWKDGKTFP
jgi:hypothetical protein